MRRHEIGDEQWAKSKDQLPGKVGDPGRTAIRGGRRKTIACSSMACSGSRRRVLRGAIFRIGSENGIPCSNGSVVGANEACGNLCSRRGKARISNA